MRSSKLFKSFIFPAALALMLATTLSACAKTKVAASIHGVNYSEDTFQYFLSDPEDTGNYGGGETVDPYSAGGTMCCFSLPAQWKPGIKVRIKISYWPPKKEDEKLKEFTDVQIVEVPRYVNGKPGELWVLRGKDGALSIVSSDYQPNHAKWPGAIKGWPVPSLEYRRKLYDMDIKHEQGGVELYEEMLRQLEESPQTRAKDSWDFAKKYDQSSLSGFSGPDDKKYIDFLKISYQDSLETSKLRVANLKKRRP
ncbi:DUF3304 domain-containing protein [Duganella sp. Leaf126]|uniref:DUF3304 domain-containing protein n=1 Tax=Duganella sp. Leaf126 TaxID=1736266 RepID=UPI000A992EA3|nr:DUF3304 domain-containing protein [Duganella sp. Leaf126]